MFTIGKSLATAMIVASATAQIAPEVEQFAAGLIYEWVDDNQLTEIEACFPTLKVDLPDLEAIVEDLEKKDFQDAIAKAMELAAKVPGQIQSCEPLSDDVEAIVAWASRFDSIPDVEAIVVQNVQSHLIKVARQAKAVIADFKSQDFNQMGKDVADLLDTALGHVHGDDTVKLAGESNDNFPTEQIVNTLAGVLYGFVKANDLPNFKTCYQSCTPLYTDLSGAVKDVIAGNPSDAVPLLKDMVSQFPGVISTCQAVDGDVQKLISWGETLDEATLIKNLMANMPAIKDDINQAEASWGTQSYFHAGLVLSDVLAKVLGPVTAPEELVLVVDSFMFLN